MSAFQSFEEMECWKKARELSAAIYAITRSGAFTRDYGLTDQVRRASVSVLSNIAEGFERGGKAEFTRFLMIAKGSAGEVRAQLFVAKDQGYIGDQEFAKLHEMASDVSRMISGLIAYLKNRS